MLFQFTLGNLLSAHINVRTIATAISHAFVRVIATPAATAHVIVRTTATKMLMKSRRTVTEKS